MPREKTYRLRLTESELRLVFTEFNAAVDNGAEDHDYPRVRDKAAAALRAPVKPMTNAQSARAGLLGDGSARVVGGVIIPNGVALPDGEQHGS